MVKALRDDRTEAASIAKKLQLNKQSKVRPRGAKVSLPLHHM
jgi:hypothetical protein